MTFKKGDLEKVIIPKIELALQILLEYSNC